MISMFCIDHIFLQGLLVEMLLLATTPIMDMTIPWGISSRQYLSTVVNIYENHPFRPKLKNHAESILRGHLVCCKLGLPLFEVLTASGIIIPPKYHDGMCHSTQDGRRNERCLDLEFFMTVDSCVNPSSNLEMIQIFFETY